jgi:C4-type Zn-finger protein
MTTITCTVCGKSVERVDVAPYDNNSTFVCEECWYKQNASAIAKEEKIRAKLIELKAKGIDGDLQEVTKEVELEMAQ